MVPPYSLRSTDSISDRAAYNVSHYRHRIVFFQVMGCQRGPSDVRRPSDSSGVRVCVCSHAGLGAVSAIEGIISQSASMPEPGPGQGRSPCASSLVRWPAPLAWYCIASRSTAPHRIASHRIADGTYCSCYVAVFPSSSVWWRHAIMPCHARGTLHTRLLARLAHRGRGDMEAQRTL